MKRILIATPAKGGLPAYYMRSYEEARTLESICADYSFDFLVEDGEHGINISRNKLANHAIAEGYDKLLMADKDHPWKGTHLARILSHDVPIVSGLYCKKKGGPPFWLGMRTKDTPIRGDGLAPADFVPTGFLCLDVKAALVPMAEKLQDREYTYTDEENKQHTCIEFFPIGLVGPNTAAAKLEQIRSMGASANSEWTSVIPTGDLLKILDHHTPNSGRLMGEDYFFSHLARRCGIPLFIDTKCVLEHEGVISFPIGPEQVAKVTHVPTHIPPSNGFTY